MQDIIIAIDGYSGCGKSSTAKEVAKILQYTYLDSGAMYRAVTLFFLRNHIDLNDQEAVLSALDKIYISFEKNQQSLASETYLNGENVEKEIRSMEVSEKVSEVSALPEVRKKLVHLQRKLGASKAVVMDGRDIGSHVFPDAELKVFMKANLDVRALRRKQELLGKGEEVSLEEVKKNLMERDRIDTRRVYSPLIKAENAVEIDTTGLSFNEQVQRVVALAKKISS